MLDSIGNDWVFFHGDQSKRFEDFFSDNKTKELLKDSKRIEKPEQGTMLQVTVFGVTIFFYMRYKYITLIGLRINDR